MWLARARHLGLDGKSQGAVESWHSVDRSWRCLLVVLALERLRQEDQREFKVTQGYTASQALVSQRFKGTSNECLSLHDFINKGFHFILILSPPTYVNICIFFSFHIVKNV